MRLLVTGATGFIGGHVAARLLGDGQRPVFLVSERYAAGTTLPPALAKRRAAFDLVYADLRNYRQTVRAVAEAQADALLHLAAVGATRPFLKIDTALRHNLYGTIHLARAAFEHSTGIQKLIIARTPGERSAMNVYAASKAAAWQFAQMLARTHGWPIAGAMLFQVYGPGQPAAAVVPSAIRAALAGSDFPLTEGKQARDWLFAGDAASGLLAALAAQIERGETVELGSGVATTVRDVVDQIYQLANQGGRPLIGALPSRPGETPSQVADAPATARRIGWTATTTLASGLELTIDSLASP